MSDLIAMFLYDLGELTVYTLEVFGVLVLILGALKALFIFVKEGFDWGHPLITIEFGESMMFSLLINLAAEIIETVFVETPQELLALVVVVAVRVGITFLLNWKIEHAKHALHGTSDEAAVASESD